MVNNTFLQDRVKGFSFLSKIKIYIYIFFQQTACLKLWKMYDLYIKIYSRNVVDLWPEDTVFLEMILFKVWFTITTIA
jgi:hypothetical protein